MNILSDLVRDLRIESRWTPALIIREPFADSPPSPVASAIGAFFRPKATVTLATGYQYASAPYGEPGASKWPLVQNAAIIGAALLVGVWIINRSRG